MIISFEGIDGSGKSTQAKLLQEHLMKKGNNNVYYTREPGWDNEISELMRTLIMSVHTSPRQKMFLLLADRAAHFDKKIGPIMSREHFDSLNFPVNTVVIMDRGVDSLVAYQGFGQQLAPVPWLVEANRIATSGYTPAVTFLIDIEPKKSFSRRSNSDYFETKGNDFYSRVRAGYLQMAEVEKERFVVLDGTKSKEDLHVEVLKTLADKFGTTTTRNSVPF